MAQETSDSPSILKFFGGILFGVILTFVYVRYAWTMPEVLKLPGKITEAAVVTTAEMDLFSPQAADEVRQRAFSVVMSQKSDDFAEIDRELGHPLLEEVLRRQAVRQAKLLKHQMSAYDVALDKPALRHALERKHGTTDDNEDLKRRMLLSAIDDDEYVSWFLRSRFPAPTPNGRIDLILQVYQNELRPGSRLAQEPRAVLQ